LLVFPETSYPYIVAQGAGGEIPMVKELGIPAIIGAMSFEPAASGAGRPKFYNSMLAVGADGKIQKIYSKSHLVPFGEYRPFGDIIPTPGQLSPGSGAETIELAGLSFAPAICYEIIFSDSLVPRGAEPRMIINITNDTWFGKTPGTYQHLDLARRQAIETGLPVVRVNYSGVSAFIAADGKIISQLPVGEAGVLDSSVSAGYETLYRRIGRDWSFVLIMIFSAAAISILGRRRKG
jgi:apolipoprotein N-acyltransferase